MAAAGKQRRTAVWALTPRGAELARTIEAGLADSHLLLSMKPRMLLQLQELYLLHLELRLLHLEHLIAHLHKTCPKHQFFHNPML